jgi:mRNA interferase RelE/StbE
VRTRFRVAQATFVARLQNSGYTLARMHFDIVFAPGAAAAYKRLKANIRAAVRDAIEMYLRHEPTKVSKSGIKRLRGLSRPQYRLRVGDIRVFYDVAVREVAILAIITKAQAESWLAQEEIPNENRGAGEV